MVYIFTEDATSGKDFIVTILELVNPQLSFIMDSACGCKYLSRVLNKYNITPRDTIVLYFDYTTLDFKTLATWCAKKSSSVYLQGFYCFESVFFSYSRFGADINFGTENNKYLSFQRVVEYPDKTRLLQVFKAIYGYTYSETVEQYANRVFSDCTRMLPCVHVSKHKYIPLSCCSQTNTYNKYFYNDKCGLYNHTDVARVKAGRLCYCDMKKQQGFCRYNKNAIQIPNLVDFYYNSALSLPYKEYNPLIGIKPSAVQLHTLK